MGLKVGRKNQGGGEKSGDEASPRFGLDSVHMPHLPKKLKPHMPHQLEKSHLMRRPGSPENAEKPAEGTIGTSKVTEAAASVTQSSKGGLSLKNPFSRKKNQQAARNQEKDNTNLQGTGCVKLGSDGVSSLLGDAHFADVTRQHTEIPACGPLSYKSFGHNLEGGNDMARLEQDHMARYGDFATFASRDRPTSTELDNGAFSIHRYDTSRGKILQQVSLAGLCSEAAQEERKKAILETLTGKTWREKLQWGLDRKNLGNAYYQQKKIAEAVTTYEDCLLALDFGTTTEEHQIVQQQLQLPVVLNLAACMLATKFYQKCKALCSVALSLDSTCLKAMFRKGLACYHMGELEEARENLLQSYRFCCGHLPGAAETLPDGTEGTSKPESNLPAFLSLATVASKDFSGRPVGDEREKFLKKVTHYLRSIAAQEKQYAAACQNMFKAESKGAAHVVKHLQSSSWRYPLGGFKLSPCSFCAKRNAKAP